MRPGFDLREVEHVVDDVEQRERAVRAPWSNEVPLFAVELRAEQQLAHADDAVHRRADLVAHVREELGLRARRALGRFTRQFRRDGVRFEQRLVALGGDERPVDLPPIALTNTMKTAMTAMDGRARRVAHRGEHAARQGMPTSYAISMRPLGPHDTSAAAAVPVVAMSTIGDGIEMPYRYRQVAANMPPRESHADGEDRATRTPAPGCLVSTSNLSASANRPGPIQREQRGEQPDRVRLLLRQRRGNASEEEHRRVGERRRPRALGERARARRRNSRSCANVNVTADAGSGRGRGEVGHVPRAFEARCGRGRNGGGTPIAAYGIPAEVSAGSSNMEGSPRAESPGARESQERRRMARRNS